MMRRLSSLFLWILLTLIACRKDDNPGTKLEDIAANEEVLAFMKTFDGRGVLSDSTDPTSPGKAVGLFQYPSDLKLELVLAEPAITQPVFIDFDHRGRLWVVQYNQYPYPRDLKVTSMDQHIRATFDKVPKPPGLGARGADKVTFFEDTDGDGTFDKATDAITGLNIATSVALGRGQIWVLNPPYLLSYADDDDNGVPDGEAIVHLEGFGLEDTHAVANNLRWGPDGWLYGAQGSTCTANINSAVSKHVKFDGQAIWRYHPETKVFEVYAEGGGNTFDIEIDEKGRFYSGDNGTSRGQYYKQGAYYIRNFGKHGALTNPYAFGFLPNMELTGEEIRFTHAFIKYEGGRLPAEYASKMIAINPLQGYVQLSRFEPNGSTFRVVDEDRILQTEDRWFRPVDITSGPDGAVYIADWYDSRLSHVDPRDTWSKKNGRIYRLAGKAGYHPAGSFDISRLEADELLRMLSHKNRWFRQQALRIIGDRRDANLIAPLERIFERADGQLALETLWALHLSGGFHERIALSGVGHTDPFVRLWTIRLLGEHPEVISPAVAAALERLASVEREAEVRSQLASSTRRFPGEVALPTIGALLKGHDDSRDPDIPLQIWWALESKAISHRAGVLELFGDQLLWRRPIVKEKLLERLMQRYALTADAKDFAACAQLIHLAPSIAEVRILANGLQEAMRQLETSRLPEEVDRALRPYKKLLEENSLALTLRQGKKDAVTEALTVVSNPSAPLAERLDYITIFGETYQPECVPVLLDVIEGRQSSPAIRQSALHALQRYDMPEIGARVAKAYPDKLRADPGVRMAALGLLATRPGWAQELLNAIGRRKLPGEKFIAHTISKDDVPREIVSQIRLLNDKDVVALAARIWPDAGYASTSEKTQRIEEVAAILKGGKGIRAEGQKVYMHSCGACHKLFGDGGTLGPELTGYDRQNTQELLANIVDPGAYVREGYGAYKITTIDGRILFGNISNRHGKSVTVKLLSGQSIDLREAEISDMQAQPSIMPDKLLDEMTDKQIRDLFAYLTAK